MLNFIESNLWGANLLINCKISTYKFTFMELMPIFVDEETKEGLYSIVYDNCESCEFDRLFDNWNDVEYVTNYCETNKEYLNTDYFSDFTIDEIISRILLEAETLEGQIENIVNDGFEKKDANLQMLFKQLHDQQFTIPILQESKAKIDDKRHFPKPILRVYGLRIDSNTFVVTGGAIKITQSMQDHVDTNEELNKMGLVKSFLAEIEITYQDDLLNFYADDL